MTINLFMKYRMGTFTNSNYKPGVVLHTCNHSTREAEAGGSEVPGQLGAGGSHL
jgi:hypothetical protein